MSCNQDTNIYSSICSKRHILNRLVSNAFTARGRKNFHLLSTCHARRTTEIPNMT